MVTPQPPDSAGAPRPVPGDPESPEALEMALNPLIFRIADSFVLIGVKDTENGPELMYADVGDQVCAVAYTDPEEIRRDLPAGYHLYQITVPKLLERLHPAIGLIIGPHAESPLTVMPWERDAVLAAALPFPPGAPVRIKKRGDRQPKLMAAALPGIEAIDGVRAVYVTRYQVADAREKILVAYDHDPDVPGSDSVADAFIAAAAQINLADPMQVVALADIPESLRPTVEKTVPPSYVRKAKRR
ncbi:MAG: SseB protein C-terminal protein [Actinomycetia bacterium]|nr:SseB protein C-terminal protein [Actinomycetes bacterium]